MTNYAHITPKELFSLPETIAYIDAGNDYLGELGYTEHGRAHAKRCGEQAGDILRALQKDERLCELAQMAGYLHDIGNIVNRVDHAHSGGVMAFTYLNKLNMPPEEIALICSAIGYHDEKTAFPVNPVSAALILADKSDVRRTRVRKDAIIATDIHDRVNFAAEGSDLHIDVEKRTCVLDVTINTEICPVMEYFEIFLERMVLCRKAAEHLGLTFELIINDTKLL
ncbi:MAG: HD domain-containing protein [Clostridia bacterium]|nr:HD domain-containing protein [Clostridia bacterium]